MTFQCTRYVKNQKITEKMPSVDLDRSLGKFRSMFYLMIS